MAICEVEGTSEYSYMLGGRWFCSLPPDHEGQHIAYKSHIVTDNGADVAWLGPWVDGRPYKGPLTDRLQEEWENRP